MGNRILTMTLVVIIGVLVGVGVVLNQAQAPMLKNIEEAQNQILTNQQGGEGFAELLDQQKALEGRLAKVEAELKQMKAGGPAAKPRPAAEDYTKKYDIPVDHSYLKGNPDAVITIVEFVDFECPFCARFHPPVAEVLKAYPDQVNYMVKNFPLSFHKNARSASKAAFAAGEQGKYHEMVDLLLQNGRNLNIETYEKLAGELGLDLDKFKKDLQANDKKYGEMIDKDMQLGLEVEVRGTPTFYLDGRKTSARDVARFKNEINKILQK